MIIFEKISLLVKFSKKFRFWLNFRKNFILVQFLKNIDFGHVLDQNMTKIFGQNFRKMCIFSEISKKFQFCQIFEKISILVKIYETHRFFREFGKIWILSNFRKYFDFGQNWRKFRF